MGALPTGAGVLGIYGDPRGHTSAGLSLGRRESRGVRVGTPRPPGLGALKKIRAVMPTCPNWLGGSGCARGVGCRSTQRQGYILVLCQRIQGLICVQRSVVKGVKIRWVTKLMKREFSAGRMS